MSLTPFDVVASLMLAAARMVGVTAMEEGNSSLALSVASRLYRGDISGLEVLLWGLSDRGPLNPRS